MDVLTLEHQEGTSKLVPCQSCGMYALFTIQSYLLLEKTCNERGEDVNFKCETCTEKISLLYRIEDLNRTINKLRERIVSLKSIKNLEKEIDDSYSYNVSVDELSNLFANLTTNCQSQVPQPDNNLTIDNIDNQSIVTSVW